MNDLDLLTDRLHELGRRAPVTAADPDNDVRRGRAALRRRHARGAAGVTTALVAAGAVATIVPAFDWRGGAGDAAVAPAGTASGDASAEPSPSPAAEDPCTITGADALRDVRSRPSNTASAQDDGTVLPFENDPEIIAVQRAYQQAAAEILDPDGTHIDLAREINEVGGGGSWTCDAATGPQLTSTGARIGWESGAALGLIVIDVAPSTGRDLPIVAGSWTDHDGRLPAGVEKARVAEHLPDGGGPTVVVERTDGLTVAVGTRAVWGNNTAPSSPPATDLPGVDRLLTLAASARLTFPGR